MFGQPIDKIATDQLQQGRHGSHGSGSGTATPVSCNSRSNSLQPPSSPTSTDASCFLETEPNPTALLLEALSKTDRATAPPSPKAQRQISLRPSEPRVPPIVRKAIALLDEKAVKTEGLFRISGSKARIHDVSKHTHPLTHTHTHTHTHPLTHTHSLMHTHRCVHMQTLSLWSHVAKILHNMSPVCGVMGLHMYRLPGRRKGG